MNKIKTTYRLPNELRQKMLKAVAETYGAKKKSLWINDAIKLLVDTDSILSTVGLGEFYDVYDKVDVVLIDENTQMLLETAMLKIRRQDPLYSGVQSAIIRAAIRKKLDLS